MSKKTALVAFTAGVAVAYLAQHVSIKLTVTDKKVAPGPDAPVVPAPTPSQAVPRPGRPRPQMRAAGQATRPKRFK